MVYKLVTSMKTGTAFSRPSFFMKLMKSVVSSRTIFVLWPSEGDKEKNIRSVLHSPDLVCESL